MAEDLRDRRGERRRIAVRPLVGRDELDACHALQERIWGTDCVDLTAPAVLKIAAEVGGVSSGAFAPGDRLVGFVFGISGFREGRPVHWSHMLGVDPESRGRGVGLLLKEHQRALLLDRNVLTALWTFDPLVARNAHLNLARLGCRIEGYERDYYGDDGGGSRLAAGIGTDRFLARWELASDRVGRALAGEPPGPGDEAMAIAPVVNLAEPPGSGEDLREPLAGKELEGRLRRVLGALPDRAPDRGEVPAVRVAIPADVHALRAGDPDRAARWRASTRGSFEALLGRGFEVESLAREGWGAAMRPSYYLVRRP